MRNTIAVTVTYGGRVELLRRSLNALEKGGVSHVIVVINDRSDNAHLYCAGVSKKFVSTIVMGSNTGSAAGFKAGMSLATSYGEEYIFLVDDDNEVEEHCVTNLRLAYEHFSCSRKSETLALLAFRKDHLGEVMQEKSLVRNNSFMGFVIDGLLTKLREKFRKKKETSRDSMIGLVTAPYGGLFFNRELIKRFGFPNEDLGLYADDSEFTYRITSGGGLIYRIRNARICDLEDSWNVEGGQRSALSRWLKGNSDFRAFYSARNLIWFERQYKVSNEFKWKINKLTYLLILKILSICWDKSERFSVLRRAEIDAREGRLGLHPDFPLK